MIKIKNIRPGIVIIADAGLKLAPGEAREIENPTRQMEKAIDDGLLARTDVEQDTQLKARSVARVAGNKAEPKKPASSQTKPVLSRVEGTDQPPASEETSEHQPIEAGQGQLIGAGDGPN